MFRRLLAISTMVIFAAGCGGMEADEQSPPVGGKADKPDVEQPKEEPVAYKCGPETSYEVELELPGLDVPPELPYGSDDAVATAVDLGEIAESFGAYPEQYRLGLLFPEADKDYYKLSFTYRGDKTCHSCFLPYAGLHQVGYVAGYATDGPEVCVYVSRKDVELRGPVSCATGHAVEEGELVGCCASNGDSVFDIGEAVLWNDWKHQPGESSTMYIRVSSPKTCENYLMAYGHFRG